jgi:hypothetical protein
MVPSISAQKAMRRYSPSDTGIPWHNRRRLLVVNAQLRPEMSCLRSVIRWWPACSSMPPAQPPNVPLQAGNRRVAQAPSVATGYRELACPEPQPCEERQAKAARPIGSPGISQYALGNALAAWAWGAVYGQDLPVDTSLPLPRHPNLEIPPIFLRDHRSHVPRGAIRPYPLCDSPSRKAKECSKALVSEEFPPFKQPGQTSA